ncbi:MAG: hypothetical protein ACODAQ_08555 [Phycisphaeraceae bacterium]
MQQTNRDAVATGRGLGAWLAVVMAAVWCGALAPLSIAQDDQDAQDAPPSEQSEQQDPDEAEAPPTTSAAAKLLKKYQKEQEQAQAPDDDETEDHDAEAHEQAHDDAHHGGHGSRLTDKSIPLIDADRLKRNDPLFELGNPFLDAGELDPGFELPGGAVWQPELLVFGAYRTAIQTFHDGDDNVAEWANRLDLFANLQLSGTERLLVGIRPLDEDGEFTGYNFTDPDEGWVNGFDSEVQTFFFEGELAELFPDLDPHDRWSLDYGFSVGRQPISFQGGMLINDDMDAVGITRNNLIPRGTSNVRATFLYGWNEIHRDDNREDDDVHLFGLFTETDLPFSTVNADVIYLNDEDDQTDGAYWGVSSVQRIGHFNTTLRMLGSHALEQESAAVSSGYLLFGELSWTPAYTHDLVYINGFWGIDNFASAARGPATGGPLGRTGLLFEAVGIGRYGAPLGNRADDAVGGAIGYQMFLDGPDKQVVFELGARHSTAGLDTAAVAAGARYQQALTDHWLLRVDAFGAARETMGPGFGARTELRFEF